MALPGTDPFGCQTSAQQACINVLNSDLAKVARAQDKSILRCLKGSAVKGESATACLALPDRGVDKARGKTRTNEDRRCAEMPPDFGPGLQHAFRGPQLGRSEPVRGLVRHSSGSFAE